MARCGESPSLGFGSMVPSPPELRQPPFSTILNGLGELGRGVTIGYPFLSGASDRIGGRDMKVLRRMIVYGVDCGRYLDVGAKGGGAHIIPGLPDDLTACLFTDSHHQHPIPWSYVADDADSYSSDLFVFSLIRFTI